MSWRNRGPKDASTGERMATIGSAAGNAMKHKAEGEHETEHGAGYIVDPTQVEALIEDWPEAPKKAARTMLERYGPPNEATPTKLFWYRNGPWKRTMVTSDVLVHNFPAPHSDYVTQWIDYQVPLHLYGELARYDGSCLLDRTAGEAAARCDSEAANLITINLMHEIVSGRMTVDEARKVYADDMMGYAMGRSTPRAERMQFEPSPAGTEDPDEDMGLGPAARQAAGKLKDIATGAESQP